jgi:FAD synthetase
MKTVLSFGTFDLFHLGHEDFLRQGRALGDRLVVVVARDETVSDVKGRAPEQSETVRLERVRACPSVDEARLGSLDDKYAVVEDIRPDVILLGYDQEAFVDRLEEAIKERELSVTIERAKPFHPELYKTSHLRNDHP